MTQEEAIPALRFPEFKGEWKKKRLSDLCDLQSGKFMPASHISNERKEGNYPCYGGNGIRGYVAKFSHDGLYPLIGRQGALCGNISLAKDKFYATEHAVASYVKTDVNETWLYYQLIRLDLNRYATGQAQPGLSVNVIEKIKSFSPPNATEQRKIADFLSAVDEKIAQLQKKKGLLEDYKKGCMQKLFSQEIRFTDNNGNPFPDWEKRRLCEFKDLVHGDGNWILSEDISQDGQYDIVQLGNVGFGSFVNKPMKTISSDKFASLNGTKILKGDLLINRMVDNNLYCCLLDKDGHFVTSVDVCWIRQNKFFDNYFLMSLILYTPNQNRLLNLSSGSGRVRISKKNLFEKFKFTLPHPDEQKKIADFLSSLDDKISLIADELDNAKTFKKGLLQQMFV